MAEAIEKVPAEMRWEIATKGLTGAIVAYSNALKNAVGEEKFNEFNAGLWYEAGKGAKQFADGFGLAVERSKDIGDATELLALTAMGPEFEFEVVEDTEDRCVGKTTKCPWHERAKELGIEWDFCRVGHQKWGDGLVDSLNPNFSFNLSKSMQSGDSCCEWVIERKG